MIYFVPPHRLNERKRLNTPSMLNIGDGRICSADYCSLIDMCRCLNAGTLFWEFYMLILFSQAALARPGWQKTNFQLILLESVHILLNHIDRNKYLYRFYKNMFYSLWILPSTYLSHIEFLLLSFNCLMPELHTEAGYCEHRISSTHPPGMLVYWMLLWHLTCY